MNQTFYWVKEYSRFLIVLVLPSLYMKTEMTVNSAEENLILEAHSKLDSAMGLFYLGQSGLNHFKFSACFIWAKSRPYFKIILTIFTYSKASQWQYLPLINSIKLFPQSFNGHIGGNFVSLALRFLALKNKKNSYLLF